MSKAETMSFPETWKEFADYWSYVDKTHKVFLDDVEVIPRLRVEQWLDHWYKDYKKLHICPFCKSDNVEVTEAPKGIFKKPFFVLCRDCGARGSGHDTKERAIKAWNEVSDNGNS